MGHMLFKHVHENEGVLFEVWYDFHEDGTHRFHSVQVLGPDYKPIGPNLAPMLDKMAVVMGAEGTMFLSAVAEELPETTQH